MKLYGYRNENGKIEQAEIDVEEKVVLVRENGENFPFTYGKQINRESIGEVIGYYPTIFLKTPDFEYAKRKFLENKRKELTEKEDISKKFQKSVESLREEINILEQVNAETK